MSDMEFFCPCCGCTNWRSHRIGEREDGQWVLKRYCEACRFEWHQDDDWKYFVQVRVFESKEEYEAAK